MDTTWTSHFFATLFDNDNAKYAEEIAAGTRTTSTTFTAPEFLPNGINFKTYFLPRKIGQGTSLMSWDQWEECFKMLDPVNNARAAVNDFMKEKNAADDYYPL